MSNEINILMVDDRPENLIALEAVLRSPNYKLTKAFSGQEALKLVLTEDFSLILLDVQMPGLNGFETASMIKSREKSKHIPIIFLTAISQASEHVSEGYSVGGIDYVFKPFDPDSLRAKVERFLKLYLHQMEICRQRELLEQRSYELQTTNRRLKELTNSLTRSEALSRIVEKTSRDTILTIDSLGRIRRANPAFEKMFGYRAADIVRGDFNKKIEDLLRRIDIEASLGLRGCSEHKSETIFLATGIKSDGTSFPVEVHCGNAQIETESICIYTIRDISERVAIENERKNNYRLLEEQVAERTKDLYLSQERFEKIFRCSPNIISIRSIRDGRYIDANQSWTSYTGFSLEEAVKGLANTLYFKAENSPKADTKGREYVDLEPLATNLRISFYTKNGERREGLLSSEPVEIEGESCVLHVVTDITDRFNLENQIARLDRLNLIGEMAAGIAHEIRNPMTSVLGFLQIALENPQALSKEHINLMIDELLRANGIITEFLTLAKNKKHDLCPTDLNQIVTNIKPLIEAEANLTDKNVLFDLGNVPKLLLDEKEIRQMILNLSLNGLEAMAQGRQLTIKTYEKSKEVILEVKDQGKGIRSKDLNKIGTPFFTTKDTGTGLGLAICYSIANRHKAQISLDTGRKGTTFYVKFPIEG